MPVSIFFNRNLLRIWQSLLPFSVPGQLGGWQREAGSEGAVAAGPGRRQRRHRRLCSLVCCAPPGGRGSVPALAPLPAQRCGPASPCPADATLQHRATTTEALLNVARQVGRPTDEGSGRWLCLARLPACVAAQNSQPQAGCGAAQPCPACVELAWAKLGVCLTSWQDQWRPDALLSTPSLGPTGPPPRDCTTTRTRTHHPTAALLSTPAPGPHAPQVVPDNIVAAAVDMNVLGIITFSLMFGLALSSLGALTWHGMACRVLICHGMQGMQGQSVLQCACASPVSGRTAWAQGAAARLPARSALALPPARRVALGACALPSGERDLRDAASRGAMLRLFEAPSSRAWAPGSARLPCCATAVSTATAVSIAMPPEKAVSTAMPPEEAPHCPAGLAQQALRQTAWSRQSAC